MQHSRQPKSGQPALLLQRNLFDRGRETAEAKQLTRLLQGCFRSCFQEKMIAACGCADSRFPTPDEAGIEYCTPLDSTQSIDYATAILSFSALQKHATTTTLPSTATTTTWRTAAVTIHARTPPTRLKSSRRIGRLETSSTAAIARCPKA